MAKEKETTIYFADGNQADIYRYEPDYYAIQFSSTGSIWYGSYLKILNVIKDYEAKLIDTNKTDNEENHPMTSVGTYINVWTTGRDYDVFIILHEAESQDNLEKIVNCNVEDTCHTIMQNNNLSTKEKKEIIQTIFDAYTDYGIQFLYLKKEGDN